MLRQEIERLWNLSKTQDEKKFEHTNGPEVSQEQFLELQRAMERLRRSKEEAEEEIDCLQTDFDWLQKAPIQTNAMFQEEMGELH